MAKNIVSSNSISLLSQAIKCENKDAIQLVISRAMDIIYEKNGEFSLKNSWDVKDLDDVIELIRGINPKDTVEMMLAAQFIALHLQSMATMGKPYINARGQGMMLMRLSHQALDMLQRYRGKGQTINVNYNTLIQGGSPQKSDDKP
jgi:hypothetical protein